MASAIIHIAIAKKIKEKLNVENSKDYYLGSIAPDISKQIGRTKYESHFLINSLPNIPNIEVFTKKYPNFKNNSFDLGYFTHLYTDKLWFENFIPNLTVNNSLKLLDGTIIQVENEQEITDMIYSDYTNINIKLIEKYNLDLSLFYEDFVIPKTTIEEIPADKLDILINKMGIIIENSKEEKTYVFDDYSVEQFIEESSKIILEELKKY